MKKLFTVVLVLALMLVPATALADVTYFTEDFESYPADIGYYPDTFTDFGVVPYVAEVVTQGSSNMFIVSNEDPVFGGYSANYAQFTIEPTETQVTLSFTFMSQIQDGLALLDFNIPDHSVAVFVYADGSINAALTLTPIAPAGTVVPGVYYDVEVVVNLVTSTADFYVDGVQWVTDVPCNLSGVPEGRFYVITDDTIEGNGLGSAVFVDDIVVTGLYTEPVNPRTGDNGSYSFVYAIISAFILVFAGFMIKRKAAVNEN